MTVKAGKRAASILAAGLLVCLAGPLQAAADANDTDNIAASSEDAAGAPLALNRYAHQGSRHRRRQAHRKSSKVALKPSANSNAADTDGSTAIPPWMANANAQMTAAEAPSGNGNAVWAGANHVLQAAAALSREGPPAADTQIMAADQLNDVDRALQASKPVAATFAVASADTPAMAGKDEGSIWQRTSSLGKIFMGLGALLTMASAVRMFMA